jgi:cytochrome b subunit of formate dehydrogenase
MRSRAVVAAPAASRKARAAEESIVRFDAHQRVQHFLMMSSFITLALTGLPQKFSDLEVSQWWVASLGGLQTVRAIHRTAGVIMLSDCMYHLGYLAYRMGIQRRLGALRMVPSPNDVGDVVQTLLYFLGVKLEKPKFDRFSYMEKFDYWAVFWGIVMIGGSGLILMFPVLASRLLPGQMIPVAITIHSDEAILAVGWILVVHMFNVHLAPWVFPFNPAIFTGKMTAQRCAEEHPLEWERIASVGQAPAAPARGGGGIRRRSGAVRSRRAPSSPPAVAIVERWAGGALRRARALQRSLWRR